MSRRHARPHVGARRFPAGAVTVLEILGLGSLAAYLVLWLIPSAFTIEWQCVGASGAQRVLGDSYVAGVSVAGTFGWLVVLVIVLYAQIVESRRLAVLLPLAWFVVLVSGALVAAALIGSQPCPS